jgi:hypothetical protein
MDHYRCSNFYVPETRAMRITATFELYPTHCSLPTVSQNEHTNIVLSELLRCIATLPRANKQRILTKITQTITNMAATTNSHNADLPQADADLPWPAEPHASKGVEHQTSTNPTAPALVRAAPRSHTRQTRANTPINPTVTPTPELTPTATLTPNMTHNHVTQQTPRRSERIALLSPGATATWHSTTWHKRYSTLIPTLFNHYALPSSTPPPENPSLNTNAYKMTHSSTKRGPGPLARNLARNLETFPSLC